MLTTSKILSYHVSIGIRTLDHHIFLIVSSHGGQWSWRSWVQSPSATMDLLIFFLFKINFKIWQCFKRWHPNLEDLWNATCLIKIFSFLNVSFVTRARMFWVQQIKHFRNEIELPQEIRWSLVQIQVLNIFTWRRPPSTKAPLSHGPVQFLHFLCQKKFNWP